MLPCSHPAPPISSAGGAVNNVATRKINCGRASGLGGDFCGPSRPKGAQACDLSCRPGNEASRGHNSMVAQTCTKVDQTAHNSRLNA